jgi:hypothetical protein
VIARWIASSTSGSLAASSLPRHLRCVLLAEPTDFEVLLEREPVDRHRERDREDRGEATDRQVAGESGRAREEVPRCEAASDAQHHRERERAEHGELAEAREASALFLSVDVRRSRRRDPVVHHHFASRGRPPP